MQTFPSIAKDHPLLVCLLHVPLYFIVALATWTYSVYPQVLVHRCSSPFGIIVDHLQCPAWNFFRKHKILAEMFAKLWLISSTRTVDQLVWEEWLWRQAWRTTWLPTFDDILESSWAWRTIDVRLAKELAAKDHLDIASVRPSFTCRQKDTCWAQSTPLGAWDSRSSGKWYSLTPWCDSWLL